MTCGPDHDRFTRSINARNLVVPRLIHVEWQMISQHVLVNMKIRDRIEPDAKHENLAVVSRQFGKRAIRPEGSCVLFVPIDVVACARS